MDGSKRSRHSNAFFYGLGAKKRIVLFDTLIDKLSAEQIEAVLAHEIGHYRKKHVLKNLAISLLLNLAGLFVLSRLISWQDLFIAFGYSGTSLHAALVLFAFCSEPLFFFIKPLFSMWSRKYEYEADSFAREQLGSGDALAQALLQLGLDNKSNLTVHPAYSFFYYSHPALPERIKAIE
jgi:STE24 endopeptidase